MGIQAERFVASLLAGAALALGVLDFDLAPPAFELGARVVLLAIGSAGGAYALELAVAGGIARGRRRSP